MQILPSTLREMGFWGNVDEFTKNTEAAAQKGMDYGARYLKKQYDRYGTWAQALSAYNAGRPISGNVASYVMPILTRAGLAGGVAAGSGALLLVGALMLWLRRKR